MMVLLHGTRVWRLQIVLVAFFGLATLSLCVIYIADPSIYTQSLPPISSSLDRYPLPVTLFLVIIIVFIALLIFGVLHHWRWIFWPLLIAFSCAPLQIPVSLLQLAGILPGADPLWYSLLRMGVAVIEGGIAVWMIQTYRHRGIWAMGKGKSKRGAKAGMLLPARENGVRSLDEIQ